MPRLHGTLSIDHVHLIWADTRVRNHTRMCADPAMLPPVPVPNLGYCCLNVTLRNQKPQVRLPLGLYMLDRPGGRRCPGEVACGCSERVPSRTG